jgi:PHP family Zn ribbon phosphoesterase
MHLMNLDKPAMIAFVNAKLKELRGVNYAFTCANCDKDYIAKNASLGEIIDQNCMECFAKMKLGFKSHILKAIETKDESKDNTKKTSGKASKGKK